MEIHKFIIIKAISIKSFNKIMIINKSNDLLQMRFEFRNKQKTNKSLLEKGKIFRISQCKIQRPGNPKVATKAISQDTGSCQQLNVEAVKLERSRMEIEFEFRGHGMQNCFAVQAIRQNVEESWGGAGRGPVPKWNNFFAQPSIKISCHWLLDVGNKISFLLKK